MTLVIISPLNLEDGFISNSQHSGNFTHLDGATVSVRRPYVVGIFPYLGLIYIYMYIYIHIHMYVYNIYLLYIYTLIYIHVYVYIYRHIYIYYTYGRHLQFRFLQWPLIIAPQTLTSYNPWAELFPMPTVLEKIRWTLQIDEWHIHMYIPIENCRKVKIHIKTVYLNTYSKVSTRMCIPLSKWFTIHTDVYNLTVFFSATKCVEPPYVQPTVVDLAPDPPLWGWVTVGPCRPKKSLWPSGEINHIFWVKSLLAQ